MAARLAATPESQLVPGKRARTPKGVTEEQLSLMRREGFLSRLLANARVIRYLSRHHQEILSEFHKVADLEPTAA